MQANDLMPPRVLAAGNPRNIALLSTCVSKEGQSLVGYYEFVLRRCTQPSKVQCTAPASYLNVLGGFIWADACRRITERMSALHSCERMGDVRPVHHGQRA
jgi:hypothetical protein